MTAAIHRIPAGLCGYIVSATLVSLLSVNLPLHAATLYVATNGDDSWSGSYPWPLPDQTDGPLATPVRAVALARAIRATNDQEALTIEIRKGTYWLQTPLVFDSRDSSTEPFLELRAFSNECPVLSGGRPVTNWLPHASVPHLWQAQLPDVAAGRWWFNQLYIDDERAVRARFPNPDQPPLHITSVDANLQKLALDQSWGGESLAGKTAELFVEHQWSCSRAAITGSVNQTVITPYPVGVLNHFASATQVGHPARLEHAFSFLDQPGEWFLDRAVGVLYLMTAEGDDPALREIIAPVLETMVIFSGEWNAPVRKVRLTGLSFLHNQCPLPDVGYPEGQSGRYTPDYFGQTAYAPPVGIEMNYTEHCIIEGCRIGLTGTGGIGIGAGSHSNRITDCRLDQIGINGIEVGWPGRMDENRRLFTIGQDWPRISDIPVGNAIADNTIERVGEYVSGAAAIWSGFTRNTLLAYNDIKDVPCTGISVGFCWQPTPTSLQATDVAFNHVRGAAARMVDCGGIYLLGYQPGTQVRGNLVEALRRHPDGIGSPINSFYLDNGASNLVLVSNGAWDVDGTPIFCRTDTLLGNTFTGNAFGAEPPAPSRLCYEANIGPRRTGHPSPGSNSDRRHVQYFNDIPAGDYAHATFAGWGLMTASVVAADEICLGHLLRCESPSAALESPPLTGDLRALQFWWRQPTPFQARIDIDVCAPSSEWVTVTNVGGPTANWAPSRLAIHASKDSRVRLRVSEGVSFDAPLFLDGVAMQVSADTASDIGPSLTVVPAFSCPTPDVTNLVLRITATDADVVTHVFAGPQPCFYVGDDLWSASVTGFGGTSVVVTATDGQGRSTTQTVSCIPPVARFVSTVGAHLPPFDHWDSAATNIQDAIDAAHPGDTVWVAPGTYASGGRLMDGLRSRVTVTSLVTVASVDGPSTTHIVGAGPFNSGFSCRGVYMTAGILTGFTISNGTTMASGDTATNSLGAGAFLSGSAILSNCVVKGGHAFRAGGIHARKHAQIVASSILANTANEMAGGVHLVENASMRRCLVTGNTAASWGGGVLCGYGEAIVFDCLVNSNTASHGGGVFFVHRNHLVNCTVVDNAASTAGGGLALYHDSEAWVVNTILQSNLVNSVHSNLYEWAGGNTTFLSSCLPETPRIGFSLITQKPDLNAGALFTLSPTSPCIDKGNPQRTMGSTDLAGNPRCVRQVDMGCWELPPLEAPPSFTVDPVGSPVPHDTDVCLLTGRINPSVIRLTVRNAETDTSLPLSAAVEWASPPLPLGIGTNTYIVSAANLAGMTASCVVTIVRSPPGTGHPLLIPEAPPALPSTATSVSLHGWANDDARGDILVSNALNHFTALFPSAQSWTSDPIPIESNAVNSITFVATNSLGVACTAGVSAVSACFPALAITSAPAMIPFIQTSASLSGSSSTSVTGFLVWTNDQGGAVRQYPAPRHGNDQCEGGSALAHHHGFSEAELCFDDDPYTYWYPYALSNGWVKYDFGDLVGGRTIETIRILPFSTNGNACLRQFHFQGSPNDHTWTTLLTAAHSAVPGWETFSVDNHLPYRWYRLWIDSSGTNWMGLCEMEMLGREGAWTIPNLAIDVGTNLLTVCASNAAGEIVLSSTTVIRDRPGDSDHDGDGSNDYSEWIAGTDPTIASSVLCLRPAAPGGSGIVLQWQSASNRHYAIWRGTNTPAAFQLVTSPVLATPPVNIFTDEWPEAEMPLFYRITLP